MKTFTTVFSPLMGVLDSLHLFKVDLKPKYVNRAVGSEPFLPSIVLRHDMAHLNPLMGFTPFTHTPRHVLSLGKRLFTINQNSC